MSSLMYEKKVDFLRHIVNRELASSNIPPQVIEDIKRVLGRAEDKYRFDAYGGDIRNLSKFLESRDFNDLLAVIKSSQTPAAVDVMIKILEGAIQAYRDYEDLVAILSKKINELRELKHKMLEEFSKEEQKNPPLTST